MCKIILDFGDGWNAKFLESVYKNNDYVAGSMADDMIRMQLKESEKCNYTIQNDLVVDGCRHKPVASTFSFFNECGDYKFCPYCGRKIEIEVEDD